MRIEEALSNLKADFSFALKRFPIRINTTVRILWLSIRNLIMKPGGKGNAEGTPELAVSLTSYGSRIKWCHLAIESIISSGVSAQGIFLWIATGSKVGKPLRRLQRRGLNIIFVTDQRSHTKYCYLDQVKLPPESLGFLIADDDMLYPKNWYSTIKNAAQLSPKRPAVMFGAQAFLDAGTITFSNPNSLTHRSSSLQGLLFHPFSGSGLFVPGSVMVEVNKNPELFMELCPTNDDIWLHREFFRMGLAVFNLGGTSMPPSIPFVAGQGLFQLNWHQGQNAVQLTKAFRGLV